MNKKTTAAKGASVDANTKPLCWIPFCSGEAVGQMMIVMGRKRAVVQSCKHHSGRAFKANFTYASVRKESDEPARRR